MIAGRGMSLITDPRLPFFFPLNSSRWNSLSRRIGRVELGSRPELDVLLTLDVEYDYGSAGSGNTRHVLPFLKAAKEFFRRHGVRATLFVQGDLAEAAAPGLRGLGRGHEIGLHGYAHEPWGASWFIDERLPSPRERKALLDKSLAAFESARLPHPTSFRAPNMVIDGASLNLLKGHGFTADSSFPSYSGGTPVFSMRHGLAEVPVSFDPKPLFGRFLMARYLVFNTHNIARGEFRDGFMNSALRAVKAQAAAGQRPFLVFLSHPWEFFAPDPGFDNEFFGYSSAGNFAVLAAAIAELKAAFNVRFTTVSEFAASVQK